MNFKDHPHIYVRCFLRINDHRSEQKGYTQHIE